MARTSSSASQANIQNLLSQGYSQEQINAFDYGKRMNPNEMQRFRGQTQTPQQIQSQQQQQVLGQQRTTALQGMQNVAGQQYQFDPQKYLPQIQQQAQGIYAPQQAQLEALRLLQGAQYETTRVQTVKDFDEQMKGEIEAINRRGAYFSGGAIERESDIRETKVSALNMLGLQASAADFSNLASQGLLAAEEAQFIQDRLYNAESSAYARWTDQRNFSYQAAVQQYQMYTDERDFVRGVFESERMFTRGVFESDRAYEQSQEEAEMKRKEFKQTYGLRDEEYERAQEEFEVDMKIKNLSYEQALKNFKKNSAVTGAGIFGLDDGGNDVFDGLMVMAEMAGIQVKNTEQGTDGPMSQVGGDLFTKDYDL